MPVRDSERAIRSCSARARGVRLRAGRAGREGWGVVVCEGGREEVIRVRAAEREWGPVEGGGRSMSRGL